MPQILIYTLILMATPVYAGQIKLYLDNSHTRHIVVEEQDCSVHKNKDGRITLGFKAGFLFFGIGPEISFGKKSGIAWDHTTQNLIARYQELCAQFNTGRLSKQEYDKRLAEIEALEKEAYELQVEIIREKKKHRQDMFNELDRETDSIQSLKNSYDRINRALETSFFENDPE